MGRGLRTADLAVSVIDALTSQICVLDAGGTIIAVNAAWQTFGVENGRDLRRSDIGVNYLDICWSASVAGVEGADAFHEGLRAVFEGRLPVFRQEYACQTEGGQRWFLARISPILGKSAAGRAPRIKGAVVSHSDITERVLLERELKHQASTDQLTGLANRRAFFEAVDKLVADVQGLRRTASVVMLDADTFKRINDRHGHVGGDRALQALARTLAQSLPAGCLAARLGGEEFALLLGDIGSWEAMLLAERIRRRVAATIVEGPAGAFAMTVSMGVSEVLCDDPSADAVLHRADRALYRAKADGRDCVRVYSPAALVEGQTLLA
ncbi:diguanylate cyclase (GGDEF) domain-containing protein [Devosia enhydra]|uniref:diguanylate cyclase n=1 Tax=Devosia enhydra TaxID=665118 RepID=A0A1K2HZ91_9HYPH|nr:sensor domain-containing diguanylate cyclase [Devosia enhydra]SFZ85442.1 diguanylate cyclase (GGDEF) domain-containing protein [Devosia enhydra]